MWEDRPRGRAGAAIVVSTVVLVGLLGGNAVALQPSFTVTATTTVGDEPVTAIAHQAGQTAELHFDYSEFGDGPHTVVIRLQISGPQPVLLTQELVLEGSTGRETVRLDQLFDLSDFPVGSTLEFTFLARGVGPDDDLVLNDSMTIETVPATVYLDAVPADVPPDEPVTVGYYGWGEPLLEGIDLFADRPPTGFDEQGEDIRITREFPDQSGELFVDGSFEFVPEEALGEVDTDIQLQARPSPTADGVPGSNVVTLTFNRPPNAVIGYSPENPETGQDVRFDGSDSTDPDGEIVEYRWDLSGDSDFESAGRFPTWQYDNDGSVTVLLRVEDDDGATDTDRLSIFIVPGPTETPTFPPPPFDEAWPYVLAGFGILVGLGILYRGPIIVTARNIIEKIRKGKNQPPVAVAKAIPSNPSPNRPVLFEGSFSFDPDGDGISSFQWTIDDDSHSSPRFVHVFGNPGEYKATLTVTDSQMATGTSTVSVDVKASEGELVLDSVHPDSPGDDHENLDDEYLVFRNDGDAPLDLSGWKLYDAAQEEGRVRPDEHTFLFPDGTELDPDERVTVHTGSGTDDGQGRADTDEARHLFWGKGRAVWNNEGDRIVVEDGDGNPVLAARYRRTDTGEYDIEPIDAQQLLDWFPAVEVSGSADTPAGGLGFGFGLESLGAIRDFVAAAFFRRGPWAFLKVWAFATVIVIGSGSIGIASSTVELAAPLVLLPVTIGMLLIGVVWLAGRWVVGIVRS